MNQNQFRLTTIARWSHPFSISNRKVKRLSADDSGLRACESRSSSSIKYKPRVKTRGFFMPASWVACLIVRSEEHTSELQSRGHLVCRLLLEKKKRTRSRSVRWTQTSR